MNLIPFKLSPHLAQYFFKEFEGRKKIYRGREVKCILIDDQSHIGKYIINSLKKIDYPVSRIDNFNIYIEMVNINRKIFCKNSQVFKKEKLNNSYVELPEESIKDIEEMLENLLRQNFYYYVLGFSEGDGKKVLKGIRKFMDDYELWNSQLNIHQLKKYYYDLKNAGPASRLQNKGPKNVSFSNK